MNLEFLNFNGYGQFILPAFIFTIASCLILYVKTKKELKKHEKMFLQEYKQFNTSDVKEVEKEEIKKEVLSGGSI